MADFNAGREGYPPAQSYTVVLGDGPLVLTATSCCENDEWLILENAGRTVGKFRLSEIAGYYENGPAVVTEQAAGAA